MNDQTPKQVPTFLDLAKTIISALEAQDRDNRKVEQTIKAQKDLNTNLEKRVSQLEDVNEHLTARVITLERELADITKAYKELTEKSNRSKEEETLDPKRSHVGDQNLEDELRSRMSGRRVYVSPEILRWILGC